MKPRPTLSLETRDIKFLLHATNDQIARAFRRLERSRDSDEKAKRQAWVNHWHRVKDSLEAWLGEVEAWNKLPSWVRGPIRPEAGKSPAEAGPGG